MLSLVLLAACTLGGVEAAECKSPPPPASSSYWTFIEACGCSHLGSPPVASLDHPRYLKACAQWRERNLTTHALSRTAPIECGAPPARASSAYWDYVEACGCTSLTEPPAASADHDRYMRACADWRERNPPLLVVPVVLEPVAEPLRDAPAEPEAPKADPSPAPPGL